MSSADAPSPLSTKSSRSASVLRRLNRLEALIDRASERLNPILVKEARQAMKSKQFVVTFTLLLICGWGWSFLGVAVMSPAIFYAPGGRFMLMGYYFVLAFPLVVIVPFSAFRSLASEREDGTYELLSISTLQPWQIVAGKLGSAVLQMIVYLSVLSPCIAFTYLLRGIDILLIVFFLFYAVMASIFLSNLGLLLATVTKIRHWQAVLSVLVILGLVVLFSFSSGGAVALISEEGTLPFDEPEFWYGHGMMLTFYVTLFTIVFLSASAQLTFRSDNRATRLRIAMLTQYILFVGWLTRYWIISNGEEEVLMVFTIIAAIHWYIMGLFMTGENTNLSPRVRRRLPQTFFGRVFLTWFFPGPTSGYMLATVSMFSVLMLVLVAQSGGVFTGFFQSMGLIEAAAFASRISWDEEATYLVIVLFSYVVIYLGLGRIVLKLLSQSVPTSVVLSLVVHFCLVALGIFIPIVVQFSLMGMLADGDDFTPIQTPNVVWTTVAVMERDIDNHTIGGLPFVPTVLLPSALFVFGLNLLVGARDIVPPRTTVPRRVEEDDQPETPNGTDEMSTPRNPWDTAG